MENKNDSFLIHNEAAFGQGNENDPSDCVKFGNTDIIFYLWKKKDGTREIELDFIMANKYKVPGPNFENFKKLATGLLGFYTWANSEEGKHYVQDSSSWPGATNIKFYKTLEQMLTSGGHPEIFLTVSDGSANIYAGIDAAKFAALPQDDQLLKNLERIRNR